VNRYPIEVLGIFIAPEHRVFGVSQGDVTGRDLIRLNEASLIENSGIEGDRFCRRRDNYNGHVTFFSKEVWDDIAENFNLAHEVGPEILRRNVVVSGADLRALYQTSFSIQNIQFLGTTHCAPCLAMNRALGKGAREALRSRGGLRAQVKSSGLLRIGQCDLATDARMNPANAATQEPKKDLP
jgi:MOSC domain-containing protein YiiM